jgi:hypothetical protein
MKKLPLRLIGPQGCLLEAKKFRLIRFGKFLPSARAGRSFQPALNRHVDAVTSRATIVFDRAIVGVKTESALLAEPQSSGVAAFATQLQAN